LQGEYPELTAAEGNPPPQLQNGGGKVIQSSWRRAKGGFRYEMLEVLEQAIPVEKATGGEVFHGGSSEMT
jgi:hypothetical protein